MLLCADRDRNGRINVSKDNLKTFPEEFKGAWLVVFNASIFVILLNFVA